jgi:hypothetical protein
MKILILKDDVKLFLRLTLILLMWRIGWANIIPIYIQQDAKLNLNLDILLISRKQTVHQSVTLWSNYSLSYVFQTHRVIIRMLSKHIKEVYTSYVYLLFKLYSNTTGYITLNLDILLQQSNEYWSTVFKK